MWLLDAFEASGKPVALAVDGVCDEAIEHQTLTRIGVCDPYEPFVSLRERLWPRTRDERRRAARARAPAVVGRPEGTEHGGEHGLAVIQVGF